MSKKIIVNLIKQRLNAFEGDKLIYDFPCVTGDAKHFTKAGKYKILRKERKYRSKQYDAQMNFAMFINNNGVAIHESYNMEESPDCNGYISCLKADSLGIVSDSLTSAISFGRQKYPNIAQSNVNIGKINLLGSHGCIRLSHSDISQLFDWAVVNTPVEVK